MPPAPFTIGRSLVRCVIFSELAAGALAAGADCAAAATSFRTIAPAWILAERLTSRLCSSSVFFFSSSWRLRSSSALSFSSLAFCIRSRLRWSICASVSPGLMAPVAPDEDAGWAPAGCPAVAPWVMVAMPAPARWSPPGLLKK